MTLQRVMLGGMPPMLRDILAEMLSREAGVEVLDAPGAGRGAGLAAAVRTASPDVLVLSAETHETVHDYIGLLCEQPVLRLVTIAEDARSAAIHTLRVDTAVVRELSLEGLLSVLRDTPSARVRSADRGPAGA